MHKNASLASGWENPFMLAGTVHRTANGSPLQANRNQDMDSPKPLVSSSCRLAEAGKFAKEAQSLDVFW
jgi:hypothetical protein